MSQEANLLRLLVQGNKEFVTSAFAATGTAAKFTSQLTTDNVRKGLYIYNNSNANSGETYWGRSTVTSATGMPIPVGAMCAIPISDKTDQAISTGAIDVYFIASAGENADLRILEIA